MVLTRSMISGVRSGSTSSAVMFSRTCAAFEAPVMTVDTLRVHRAPSERELGERDVQFVGDHLEVGHLLVLRFIGQHLLQPFVAGQ